MAREKAHRSHIFPMTPWFRAAKVVRSVNCCETMDFVVKKKKDIFHDDRRPLGILVDYMFVA